MKSIKKLIFVLIMALLVVAPIINVDAKTKKTDNTETTTTTATTTTKKSKKEKTTEAQKEGTKVKFYIFYGDGCPHCSELHEYVAELEEDKTINYMFDVVDYEVWNNQTNYNLMVSVAENFKFDVQGVPFYVIGDKYYSGFGDSSKTEIIDTIKSFYSGDKEYKDVVSTIGKGESDGSEEEVEEKTDSNLVGMIILGVVVVVIIVLIIASSKSKDETEEAIAEAEEVKEEVIKIEKPVETKKAEKKSDAAKKTTAKKTTTKKTTTKTNSKTAAKKTTAKKTSTKKK